MSKRILITGAGGFVGQAVLAQLLQTDHEVHALSRRPAPLRHARLHWHQQDLFRQTDELLGEIRAEQLLHLAWQTEPGIYLHDPDNLRWVSASLDLLRAFYAQGGERAVLAGTCAEYDAAFNVCHETTTPYRPESFYAVSKQSLHQLALAYARQIGGELAWAHVFYLYGPGENPQRLVASVAQSLLRRERARCSPGQVFRDYLYIEDLASALLALLASPITGAVNLASGQAVRIRDLVGLLAELEGWPDGIDDRALPARPGESPYQVADISRMRLEADWAPRYTLESGLAATLSWWKGRIS